MKANKTMLALRLLFLMALAPLFVEGFLRVFLGYPLPHVWVPGMDVERSIRDQRNPLVQKVFRFRTNDFGTRGQSPAPGQDVLLFLGSSTTECDGISNDSTWPEAAVKGINGALAKPLAGMNAARSGMQLPHNLLHFQALAEELQSAGHRIKAVVFLAGASDLEGFLSNPRPAGPFEEADTLRKALLYEQAFRGLNRFYPDAPWYKRNLTWPALSRLKSRFLTSTREEAKAIDHHRRREMRSLSRRVPLPAEKEEKFAIFLETYRKNLRLLARLCQARGIPLILMSQPMALAPQDRRLWHSGHLDARLDSITDESLREGKVVFLDDAGLEAKVAVINQATRQVAEEFPNGFFVDLAAMLPQDTGIFFDTFHFTEKGCAAAAAALSRNFPARAWGQP